MVNKTPLKQQNADVERTIDLVLPHFKSYLVICKLEAQETFERRTTRMPDSSKDQNVLLKQIAYAIHSDIRKYIDENIEEFNKWLEANDDEKIGG